MSMDTVTLILIIIGGMSIALLAANLWVGIIDGIIKGLKKVFHIKRRREAAWHPLAKDDSADFDKAYKDTTQSKDE